MEITFLNLPDEKDNKFRRLLQPRTNPSHTTGHLQAHDDQQSREWSAKRRHAPYVSFGDQGTTTSAGAYGSLMRVCRYVKRKNNDFSSRLVGLEFNMEDTEAWYVCWRASQFLGKAQDQSNGFGLRIIWDKTPTTTVSPTLDFLADRWPVITYQDDSFEYKVTLWCQHSVVVQNVRITNQSGSSRNIKLALNLMFAIQDLNYLEKKENIKVRYQRAPHGYGIIALEDQPDFESDEERVCVVIGLFKNGVAQKLPLDSEDIKEIPIEHEFSRKREIEFTATLTIQTTTLKENWKRFIFSSKDLNCDTKSSMIGDATTPFPANLQLSWHLRRNLEHIMSVCSIPLETAARERRNSGDESPKPNQGPMVVLTTSQNDDILLHESLSATRATGPVALTCGDFGDHRVSVSGSFFAFMFMLEMHCHLSNAPVVQQRIHETCKGHLKWARQLKPQEALSSNLRVDGRLMVESEETFLPPDSPSNMPSHIIKAIHYVQVFQNPSDLEFVCSWLAEFVLSWFGQLIKTKNHLTPTWQHSTDSEIPIYRLSDQVWIWKALKGIEDLIKHVEDAPNRITQELLKKFRQIKTHLPSRGLRKSNDSESLSFTAEEMRKEKLRRFTLENDILKKRMLSVTRSARETRFLLHSRDTILYYGIGWDFFPEEETVWQQLINSQIQHEEDSNDEATWDNPLRYGLALEMAGHDHQLDRNFPPSTMATHAKKVIIDSSSENGLFPGQLDGFSKEPALFDSELWRDFYFHVGFEIPYILFRTAKRNNHSPEMEPSPRKVEISVPALSARASKSNTRPRDLSPGINTTADGTVQGYINFQADGRALVVQRSLKRQNPYGGLVDLSNIVEVPEEWLYRYPDFLDFAPPTAQAQLALILPEKMKTMGLNLTELNTWVTEVHFRFFRARKTKDELPKQSSQCVRQLNAQPCGIFGRDAYLVDAVISFRIVGDYFVRYWTCHVVEEIVDKDPPLDKQNTHWQQRKVLELMLFNRILEKVCHSLDEILKDIEVGPGSSSLDAGKKYFSSASFEDRKPEELRECFQLLVILKNNVTNLLGLIEQWTNRESSRGRDRPRWTRNDEQKYRKSIKQKMAHLEDHIRDIKAKTARIEFLIALVTNAQDAVRSKKSLKEAENINLFTYVTVFFLPVGLAVSIFSMNGTPDHAILVYMVITAAVALLVTAFFVMVCTQSVDGYSFAWHFRLYPYARHLACKYKAIVRGQRRQWME